MNRMTPHDFEQAFSDEATPEQIEDVDRACALVEGIWYIDPAAKYVQDCNNQERFIRAAMEITGCGKIIDGVNQYTKHLEDTIESVFCVNQHYLIATAPQWARLYAAYKARGGGE